MDFRYTWLVLMGTGLSVFLCFEIPGIAEHMPANTLSDTLRWLFHTGTLLGRVGWLVVWFGFAIWLGVHIALPHGWHTLIR